MCGPMAVPIAMGIIMAGKAIATYVGEKQQQSAQLKAQKTAQQLAQRRFAEQTSALQQEANATKDAGSQRAIEKRIETMRAKASARVSAGEAGVGGLSVDAVLMDLGGAGGRAQTAINTATDARIANIGTRQRMANFEVRAARTKNAAKVGGPSIWSLGLGIAAGAATAYGGITGSPTTGDLGPAGSDTLS